MCVCVREPPYRRGVLLLLVQPGAAPLLTVAVLLQRVEDLVGELQVHQDTITHLHLWSKLERVRQKGESVEEAEKKRR